MICVEMVCINLLDFNHNACSSRGRHVSIKNTQQGHPYRERCCRRKHVVAKIEPVFSSGVVV